MGWPKGKPRKKNGNGEDVSQDVSHETQEEETFIDEEFVEESPLQEDPKAHIKKELSELEDLYQRMKARGVDSYSKIEVLISQVRSQL